MKYGKIYVVGIIENGFKGSVAVILHYIDFLVSFQQGYGRI